MPAAGLWARRLHLTRYPGGRRSTRRVTHSRTRALCQPSATARYATHQPVNCPDCSSIRTAFTSVLELDSLAHASHSHQADSVHYTCLHYCVPQRPNLISSSHTVPPNPLSGLIYVVLGRCVSCPAAQDYRNRGRSTLLPTVLRLTPSFCMHAIAWITAADDWARPPTQVKVEHPFGLACQWPTTACVPIVYMEPASMPLCL